MKNLSRFDHYNKWTALIENVDSEIETEFNLLEKTEHDYSIEFVNEGIIKDFLKNNASKFFFGDYSKIGMIDKTRGVLLNIEIETIKKRSDIEDKIDALEAKYDSEYDKRNRAALDAIQKDIDSKSKEYDSFKKLQSAKVEKVLDFIEKLIDGNRRRKMYYEAGRADDRIVLAELEYKIARKRSDNTNIKKWEDEVKQKKDEAERKAAILDKEMEDAKAAAKAKKEAKTKPDANTEKPLDKSEKTKPDVKAKVEAKAKTSLDKSGKTKPDTSIKKDKIKDK